MNSGGRGGGELCPLVVDQHGCEARGGGEAVAPAALKRALCNRAALGVSPGEARGWAPAQLSDELLFPDSDPHGEGCRRVLHEGAAAAARLGARETPRVASDPAAASAAAAVGGVHVRDGVAGGQGVQHGVEGRERAGELARTAGRGREEGGHVGLC
jgi:hypothetical protein